MREIVAIIHNSGVCTMSARYLDGGRARVSGPIYKITPAARLLRQPVRNAKVALGAENNAMEAVRSLQNFRKN